MPQIRSGMYARDYNCMLKGRYVQLYEGNAIVFSFGEGSSMLEMSRKDSLSFHLFRFFGTNHSVPKGVFIN